MQLINLLAKHRNIRICAKFGSISNNTLKIQTFFFSLFLFKMLEDASQRILGFDVFCLNQSRQLNSSFWTSKTLCILLKLRSQL